MITSVQGGEFAYSNRLPRCPEIFVVLGYVTVFLNDSGEEREGYKVSKGTSLLNIDILEKLLSDINL